MSDEDYGLAAQGVKASGGPPGKHRSPRFTWNSQYEATFFRSLCESVNLGLREGSTFKPEAWDRAIQALIDKHNAYANKSHLINKSDNARKKYRLWRGLREDNSFYYNPQNRTVTGTEEAWARHLQKEPLARSLKGRPFDHEEYYEILFPDVPGSGGAPKRLTKPRRKGPDGLNGADDHDAPGTSIMDMLTDTSYLNPVQTHIAPLQQQPNIVAPTMPAPLPAPPPQQLSRPPAPMAPPPQPRASVTSTTSALTPPEENPQQPRKRMHAGDNGTSSNPPNQPEKRRRTAPPNFIDLQQQQNQVAGASPVNHATHSTLNNHANQTAGNSSSNNNTSANASTHPGPNPALPTVPPVASDITVLADALRGAKARPTWQEQAMEILFGDFRDEDPDLQIKIAEKLLIDENKAMFFCKMPDPLRKHWVKRLREVHNNRVS
ncbi:Myb/SANT-like DNA-binding domain-containing protein [Apiosordaria backusii]|uniref:Myb/SANT-like DNA-binding domain-containing protein n=1 Tax=Apiosordaria backusii TaxID=314023 RepID=A0AA40BL59_9PEZI|nr:Myb/SANT-like DNA-binding domain-containing protein [Apiosordaria backusii]